MNKQPEVKEDQTGTKAMAVFIMVILTIVVYIAVDIIVNVATM